jgi:hypothetical protein
MLAPGPGQYNPSDIILKKDPTWAIGTGQRSKQAHGNSPGPGNYEIKPKIQQGPQYTMRLKPSNTMKTLSPGPGAYNQKNDALKEHHPTHRIGTELKLQQERTTVRIVPGPGNYTPHSRPRSAAPSYGFGTGHRRNPKQTKDMTPGPG